MSTVPRSCHRCGITVDETQLYCQLLIANYEFFIRQESYLIGGILSAADFSKNGFMEEVLTNMSICLTSTYRLSCTMLYVVMARSVSAVFRQIATGPQSTSIAWKKRMHSLGCQCVDQINACFGPILLIDCLCIFISLIMSCFHSFLIFRGGMQYLGWGRFHVLYTIQLSVQLWLIGYVAAQLRHDVK